MKLPVELFKFSILKTFTKAISLTICVLLLTQTARSQIMDDFSDGDFLGNPPWSGSVANFNINTSKQLQLNAVVAGTSFLSTAFEAHSIGDFEWQLFVKQSFSPSGGNYGRVYLTSDHADLTAPLNGYYLQFGEAGANDAIELFRQSGLSSISVCRAANGRIATSFAIRIRVVRNADGWWQLFIDYSGGFDFSAEASGFDATHCTSSFLGVRCTYTISNSKNFYFDDFLVGPQIVDVTPPSLLMVRALSEHELEIEFDETVEKSSAEVRENYTVSRGVGTPESAFLLANEKTARLTFAQSFPNGQECLLTATGIRDKSNNMLTEAQQPFVFTQPVRAKFKDVIITEILADPSPTIGLPEAEYIELYNRSNVPLDLSGWKFTDGSSSAAFPAVVFAPAEYLILTSSTAAPAFSSFGKVLGVSSFPTLNNAGDNLVLRNKDGNTIDSVSYSDSWFVDADKKAGGWSLELIDTENVCGERTNWTATEHPSGGTPGKQNSVFANKPDLTGPKLISAIPLTDTRMQLVFDEKLEKQLPATQNINISPNIQISKISFADASLTAIILDLLEEISRGTTYTVALQNIFDCAGNRIQTNFSFVEFALPEEPAPGDVVINEILFNPRPTGVDFLEIFNRSQKYFNLKGWQISNYENGSVKNKKVISQTELLLKPLAYMVLTTNGNVVKGEYVTAREENFWKMDLPSFNDDKGSAAILDAQDNVLDDLQYTKSMHSVFIKNEEGVSLERVSAYQQTNETQNWKSASSVSGFATPGYSNSNSLPENSIPDNAIRVEPEIFEPITGQPDYTQIKYSFDQGGFVANVKVFDPQGRTIKQIANNEVLGTEGFFRWDGDRDDGTKVRIGYYMVWFEVFDANGMLKTFRKRVAVATKF